MKAAVMRGIGNINVEEVPDPEPEPDQVKVKIAYCGICGTDPENLEGRFGLIPKHVYEQPRILGHEASGTVAAVGKNVTNFKVGQRVACDFRAYCGACYYCHNKMEHFCRNGVHTTGSFAEYAYYPESAVYALPDDISLEVGALLEPLSVAVHAVDMANVYPGCSVAISGAGPIGLLSLEVAIKAGATRTLVSEPIAEKRELARKLGADITVDPLNENLEETGKKFTDGRGFNSVIEASGNIGAAKQAITLADYCGTVLWAAVYPADAEVSVSPFYLYTRELTIRSIFTSPYSFTRSMNLLSKLDIKPLITHIVPLEEIRKAFDIQKEGKSVKILIKP